MSAWHLSPPSHAVPRCSPWERPEGIRVKLQMMTARRGLLLCRPCTVLSGL